MTGTTGIIIKTKSQSIVFETNFFACLPISVFFPWSLISRMSFQSSHERIEFAFHIIPSNHIFFYVG